MTGTPYHPSRRQRFANRMLRRLVGKGKGPDFLRLLTVTGRRSGEPRTTPVVPVEHDGHLWLVAPFGEVDWVRNVRAARRVELRRGDDATTYAATEVDPTDAQPIIDEYLAMPSARFVKPYDPQAAHPVFALR